MKRKIDADSQCADNQHEETRLEIDRHRMPRKQIDAYEQVERPPNDSNRDARFELSRISFGVEAQPKRVAIVIANCAFGLPCCERPQWQEFRDERRKLFTCAPFLRIYLRAYSEASQEIIPHVTRVLTKSVIPAANFWQMRPSPPPASLHSRKKQQEWCKSSNPRQAALAR